MSSDEHTSVDSSVDDLNVEDVAEIEITQPDVTSPVLNEFGIEDHELSNFKEENEMLTAKLFELQMVNELLNTDILIWQIYNQELEAEVDRLTKIVQSFWLLQKIEDAWKNADVLGTIWTHKHNANDIHAPTDGCVPSDRDLIAEIPTCVHVIRNTVVHEDADYVHIDIPTDDHEFIVLSLSDLGDI